MNRGVFFFVFLLFIAFSAIGQEVSRSKVDSKSSSTNAEVTKTGLSLEEISAGQSNADAKSQGMKMKDGTSKICFGEFFDSGGPTGSYKTNESYTYTIETETEGAHFILRFVEFLLSNGDELTVYDGSSIDAKVIGTFSNSNPMPFELKSTGGSLTFVFNSDAEGNGSGWRASIGCYVGERKVLRTDGTVPFTRLIYQIGGLKSESDFSFIEDNLKNNAYVLYCSYDKGSNFITVAVSDESYKDIILEQIKSSMESLGYEITVILQNIIPAK